MVPGNSGESHNTHAGILVLPHVPRADLPTVVEAIDRLVANPLTVLDTALFGWTESTGWR